MDLEKVLDLCAWWNRLAGKIAVQSIINDDDSKSKIYKELAATFGHFKTINILWGFLINGKINSG